MAQASRSTFGKYVLLRKLASGGMGEIFLAKQRGPSGFEKLLVIKRILSHHLDKRDYLDMFFSEAKLVARLNHNNIIQIHEMGEIDGDYYIAMEYVRGKSLRDIIDELRAEGRTLPLPHVIDLAIKLCEGLGYAHQARDIRGHPMNIVHRDINPHNILISYTGDLKLIDFGIAKSEMTSVHTATGTIKGKFVYMSPEQSAADPIDRRSDIFSLGIVLYEITCLENPFVRQNVVLSLEAIQRQDIPLPSDKRADAAPLDTILTRALEKKSLDRYQTATEMRDDLRNLFRTGSVTPADEDISTFLHDLFSADIDEEDRLLAEADQATTPPEPSNKRPEAPVIVPSVRTTPKPITTKPFSDEEPTLSGDLDNLAARSREVSKGGKEPEPSGPVMTLIPPDEVEPGTGRELGDLLPEIPTRSDRLPLVDRDKTPPRPPPPANFDEPLQPTRELRAGGSLAPDSEPDTQVPPPPFTGPKDVITDEDDSALTQPTPPWRRAGRIMLYLLVLLSTAVAGFMATQKVIGPRINNAPIPPIDMKPVDDPPDKDPVPPPVDDAKKAEEARLEEQRRQEALAREAEAARKAEEARRQEARELREEERRAQELEEAGRKKAARTKKGKRRRSAEKKRKRKEERRRAEEDRKIAADKKKAAAKKKKAAAAAKRAEAEEMARRAAANRAEEVRKRAEKKKAERAAKEKERKVVTPKEPRKEKGARLGTLTLRAPGEIRIEHNGRSRGSTPASLPVRKSTGRIKLHHEEYSITLDYTLAGEGVSVKVKASPWAILKHNGLSLGRTPQRVSAGRTHRFSFIRPGQRDPFVVSLLFSLIK